MSRLSIPCVALVAVTLAACGQSNDRRPGPGDTPAPVTYESFVRDVLEKPENSEAVGVNDVRFIETPNPAQFDDVF